MSNKIVEYRKERGMTQLTLAVRSELHPSGLSRLEQGVRCTRDTARKIATALDADVREVFPEYETFRAGGAK